MSGADSGDGEGADPGQQAERSADDPARGDPGGRAFGGLGAFFVRPGAKGIVVRQKDGDVGVAKGRL